MYLYKQLIHKHLHGKQVYPNRIIAIVVSDFRLCMSGSLFLHLFP